MPRVERPVVRTGPTTEVDADDLRIARHERGALEHRCCRAAGRTLNRIMEVGRVVFRHRHEEKLEPAIGLEPMTC